jgi:low molecular weight protein-tyrosine phosphatase
MRGAFDLALFVPKQRILFVCTANICRSPLAEGMMRKRLRDLSLHRKVEVRSAGTRAGQRGRKPDARVWRVAETAGVSLAGIKSSQLSVKELARSDCIVAMDKANLRDLMNICPAAHQHKIHLLTEFAEESAMGEIPDPYYGNLQGFAEVYRLIDGALTGLLNQVAGQLE